MNDESKVIKIRSSGILVQVITLPNVTFFEPPGMFDKA